MNYYEKHIGDFIRDTVSLSMLEDGAYNRLLDQVYQTERALPADKKEVYRVARATSAAERKAVDYVLGKFFHVTDDGYMQKRAQVLIEDFWDRQPAEENKRDNAKARQQRARARRQSLFEQLRELGITPEFNAPSKQLEIELSRVTKRDGHSSVTRDDTLTQPPTTNHQSPDLKPKGQTPPDDSTANNGPSAVGELCIAMRAAGVETQPHDPRMMALAEQGVLPETLTAACAEAKKSKPNERITPGYVLGILARWSKEAAALNVRGAAQPRASPPGYQTTNEKAKDLADRLTGKKRNEQPANRLIDLNDAPA